MAESDSSLRMPPIKPAPSKVGFQQERYDSITGQSKENTEIYIMYPKLDVVKVTVRYSNSRAYPQYLLTYEFMLKFKK